MQMNSETSKQSKPRILVVDDKDFIRRTVSATLRDQYDVITAASVDEALCAFDDYSDIELVLLDWYFEGGTDITPEKFMSACRARDQFMPIVVMSGIDDMRVREAAFDAGANSFLDKPFGPTELKVHIARLVQEARERVQLAKGFMGLRSESDVRHLDEISRIYTLEVVQLCRGNVSRAAELLGIHRHTVKTLLQPTDHSNRTSREEPEP